MNTIMALVAAGWCLAALVATYRNVRNILDAKRRRREGEGLDGR